MGLRPKVFCEHDGFLDLQSLRPQEVDTAVFFFLVQLNIFLRTTVTFVQHTAFFFARWAQTVVEAIL